jgi:hypothetical protein
MNILDRRRQWIPAEMTNIRATLKAHGHVPPEQHAQEVEQNERLEGALRCMRRIQAEGGEQ